MKKLIVPALFVICIIGCSSSSKKENDTENNGVKVIAKDEGKILPDSLFYKIGMSFFDMSAIPYDESIGSQRLKLATGTFRQKVIGTIKEFGAGTRSNVMYLSKEAENETWSLITVYTENDTGSRSIYLLSLDKNLDLIDHHKIGYNECDLESQTDTCEVSFCDA